LPQTDGVARIHNKAIVAYCFRQCELMPCLIHMQHVSMQ